MYTMNKSVYDQQSESAPVIHQAFVIYPQSFQAPVVPLQSPAAFPQFDFGLVVPSFLPTDDPIASFNNAMAFNCTTFTLIHPPINNQLENSSNPRNQVTMQGRQTQSYRGNCTKGNATGAGVIRDTRNSTEARVELDAEQLALLVDARKSVDSRIDAYTLTTNDIFQTDGIKSFDSNCDEVHVTQATFVANLSYYGSDVLSEVPNCKTYHDNTVFEQNVQKMQDCEQAAFVDDSNIEFTNESNMISYEQYLKENESEVVHSTPSPDQQESIIMSVIEEMSNQVSKWNTDNQENKLYIDSQLREVIVNRNAKVADFENQIHSLKLQLNAIVESHKTLSTTLDVLKIESKAKEDKYLEEIIELEKKKALDNVVYKMGQLTQMMHMEAHVDYLKHTKEHADTLHDIVEKARDLRPLDSALDFAYYLNDVNARVRNKSIKSVKRKEWKPNGKVFTNVGHKWVPT
ncbi:hypothetical protein Tco_0336341 [Tanacetum coccineum]